MRFQNYILEETRYKKKYRGREVSLDEIKKIILNYSDGIKVFTKSPNSVIMTRSVSNLFDYKIIDPKKEEPRKSRNTFNYYTFIIDNSKKWSKYPKRSKSIICLNDIYSKMGDYYYWVLPKNNAKIGECPEKDFWFSFKNFADNMDYDFNELIRLLLNFPYIDNITFEKNDIPIIKHINTINWGEYTWRARINLKRFDSTLFEFKKACKNFDNWWKKQKILNLWKIKSNFTSSTIKFLAKWNEEPLYDYLEKILDPDKNGFRVTDIKNLKIKKESWTDSECLIIHYSNIMNVINEYKKLKGI